MGYPLKMETEIIIKGFTVSSTDEIIEMAEKDPPAGVYSIPQGFTKKDQLTREDLQGQ